VPLSEEELRLLEQMERALVEEDPKFASTLRWHDRCDSPHDAKPSSPAWSSSVASCVLMTGVISRAARRGHPGLLVMLVSATSA
jgi:hypothetical protein